MFLMPYLRNVTRPHFPVGVILLVVINLFVFFGLQQRDEARYHLAFEYYAQSVLPRLELPAYADYLKKQRRADDLKKFEQLSRHKEALPYVLHRMDKDAVFMRALRAGQVITPEHEDYAQWRQAREHFERSIDSITIKRYAFDTDHPSWLTAFTHQFLHGGTGHLIGNMVVLIAIAPAVEALLGTGLFLLIYLLGGLGAVALHWLIVGSGSGLVGASGAISAVMGAFAVLLYKRRIPFFYFVVVYFDIVRAPALIALPIWLANELLQLVWNGNSQIAYGAHIGGLLTGSLLAWFFRKRAAAQLLPEGAAKRPRRMDRPAPTHRPSGIWPKLGGPCATTPSTKRVAPTPRWRRRQTATWPTGANASTCLSCRRAARNFTRRRAPSCACGPTIRKRRASSWRFFGVTLPWPSRALISTTSCWCD